MSIKLGTINIAGGISETSVINGVVIEILDSLYPLGALYITSNSATTCPMQTLGVGMWQLVAQDRVLQGAGTRGTVGSTLPESLPNIKGTFRCDDQSTTTPTGAFVHTGEGATSPLGNASRNFLNDFNASRSSSIYQDNAHVQPSAYLVNIWQRVS